MTTPSGRFHTSTRLCLSISDFHPKSFNPAWEVSTILIGLLSFMTSEEMTTGSVSCSGEERRRLAGSSRWWNSTNGGKRVGSDGGRRFREEWGEVDAANWSWMEERRIDPQTGCVRLETSGEGGGRDGAVRERVVVRSAGGREQEVGQVVLAGESWIRRNKIWVGALVVVGWVLLARALE
jgi:ubiquitin-conjugating enzyme E2 J2